METTLNWQRICYTKYSLYFSVLELKLPLLLVCFSAAVVPSGASAAKPQPSYSYNQSSQLFSVQPKVEASASISAATTNQTWKIMESLNLGPQPKATPVPTFTIGQATASSSSSTSSSTTTSTANQDYSTVNLSDLHEFFPNISSGMAQVSATSQASTVSSQASSSFTLQSSQFRVDAQLGDDEIPEFPSFSEAQAPGTLDSLNMDDFVDLLNPRLMSESGNGVVALAQGSCQQAAPPSSSTAAQNIAVPQNTDPASNPGSTWMNYPTSIVSLLQNEGMMDIASNNNNHRPAELDEFDELMSADEDRLMSIFQSESQPGFVSGQPT